MKRAYNVRSVAKWMVMIAAFLLVASGICSSQDVLNKGMKDITKTESVVLGTEKIPIIIRSKLAYDPVVSTDPFDDFLPKVKKTPVRGSGFGSEVQVAPLPAFNVQGIVWGGAVPQAVIDDQVVKIGDIVQDAEIVEISKDGIKVLYNKRIYKLGPPSSAVADANASKNK